MSDDRTSRDLEMIVNPDRWPVWPVLPMKRTTSPGRLETAFFFNTSVTDDTVQFYVGNLYDRKNAVEQDMTPEQVVDQGWRVD